MPITYFAYGTTLANMQNFENVVSDPSPHVMSTSHMPLMGNVKTRLLSGRIRRDGDLNGALIWDYMSYASWRALVYATMGSFTTASAQLYVTTITPEGYYSPFLVWVEQPYPNDGWTARNQAFVQPVAMPITGAVLQSATKTANYTVTTSDRLVYANTASGNITLTLPSAATVTAYTVYSFQKTSASNDLVIDPPGLETLDGATSQTITALNARVDIVSDGSNWLSVTA